jgi:membrane-associated phospholipid phosphatase
VKALRIVALTGLISVPAPAASQLRLDAGASERSSATDSSFWRNGDHRLALATLLTTGAVAIYDERIARWARSTGVQGDSSRHDLVGTLTVINEVPLTIAAVAVYGVGRIAGNSTIADVGAHVTASLLATEIIAEVVRIGLGRARPRASPDDAFLFHPGRGLTQFEYRSFPSLHAAVAFATAAALAEEMRLRNTAGRRYVVLLLYAAAAVPGFTRLYLDQHWASDVLAGTAVGAFLGTRVVRYLHGRRTPLDRLLIRVNPLDGRAAIGVKLVY